MAKLRLQYKEQRRRWLRGIGFLPEEAEAFSDISIKGLRSAPYARYMIRSRRALIWNARRYDWEEERIKQAIRNSYDKYGAIRADGSLDPWAYYRELEERSLGTGKEYESPWRKRTRRASEGKREAKRVTRKATAESWIKQLDEKIAKTPEGYRRDQLIKQRDNLQEQLDRME